VAIFRYPNKYSPTTTITISPLEEIATSDDTELGYVVKETAGRVIKTRQLGSDVVIRQLRIRDITTAEKELLKNFILNTLSGPTDTFDLEDDEGVEYLGCRFVDNRLSFRRTTVNSSGTGHLWVADMLLRVVAISSSSSSSSSFSSSSTSSSSTDHIDLTAFTEVDPNSRIVVDSIRSEFTGLTRNEDAYVYKDYGIDNYDDFEINTVLRINKRCFSHNVGRF
jgi:hypothetical protein